MPNCFYSNITVFILLWEVVIQRGAFKLTGVFSIAACDTEYQRNGDGEAKSPAGRAGIREAVLYPAEPST